MFLTFSSLVDKMSSNTYAEISVLERDRIFNIAIDRFVKERYGVNNVKREGFEVTQKRTDDLSNLTSYEIILPYSEGTYSDKSINTSLFELPSDYWFSLQQRLTALCKANPPFRYVNDCGVTKLKANPDESKSIPVSQKRHDEINSVLLDPFNKPTKDEAFSVIKDGDKIKVTDYHKSMIEVFYLKDIKPESLSLTYLKEPKWLNAGVTYSTKPNESMYYKNTEFWFNSSVHQEIVDIAARTAIETLENPRYNTFAQELQNNQE